MGDKIPQFLIRQGFYDWKYTDSTSDYFPKFMSRYGSWAYSFTADGKAGPGLLIHNNEFQEPSPEIKEVSMGYDVNCTSIEGISSSIRHKILGACMDLNISKWLLLSSLQFAKQHPNVSSYHSNLPPSEMQNLPDQWIVDGGATSHFTGHRTDFFTFQDIPPKLVKGMNLHAVAIGQVKISVNATLKSSSTIHGCSITHHNVLYVPDLLQRGESVTRLLSQRAAHRIEGNNNPVFIDSRHYSVIDMGKLYIPLDQLANPNLLTLHSKVISTTEPTEMALSAVPTTRPLPRTLWHHRLGHISNDRITKLETMAHGIKTKGHVSIPPRLCHSCVITKSVRFKQQQH